MSSRFEERLRTGPPIVADGGMGTLLSGAVPRLRCPEEANLRAPESVVAFHASFIRAGAELIETNTFGANRRKLAAHFLEDELEQINSTAVRLAREAREVSGADVFIAGSIGPLGEVERFDAEQSTLFAEQAQVLEGRGVDLLMLETFFDLDELVAAIDAVRSVSSLPIVALMTFDADGQTLGGVSAGDAADRLAGLDVAAAGANHSAGPAAALNALAAMQRDGLVLAALPNVGLASLAGSRVVFPHATPDYFAEFAAQARRLGAGSSAAAAGRRRLRSRRSARRSTRSGRRLGRSSSASARWPTPPTAATEETKLARMLREQEFVVSVQLDPPLGANNSALIEAGRTLRESGKAHFVDVNDNPRARARMSGIMASVAIEREAGIETIPHLTTRDMSVAGLESLLLGAHAEGLHNVLAVTGDPPEEGDYPGARGVYEVDAIGLTDGHDARHPGDGHRARADHRRRHRPRFEAPTEFVLPGENRCAAALDLARTIVRRAERESVTATTVGWLEPGSQVVPYLNRLADLCWTLARWQEGEFRPARPRRHALNPPTPPGGSCAPHLLARVHRRGSRQGRPARGPGLRRPRLGPGADVVDEALGGGLDVASWRKPGFDAASRVRRSRSPTGGLRAGRRPCSSASGPVTS